MTTFGLTRLLGSVLVVALLFSACSSPLSTASDQAPASPSASTTDTTPGADTSTSGDESTSTDTASTPSTTVPPSTTTTTTTTTSRPEPQAETDPAVLAEFVSEHNGDHQLTDAELTVTDLEVGENKENIPAEIFVDPDQWRLFQILGLVDPDDDAAAVGQHRVNTIRGICCPVSMWDNDDHPLLRSSVLVHELTHLADDDRSYYDDLDEDGFELATREKVNLLGVPVEGNASRVQQLYVAELEAEGALPERFIVDWGDPAVPDAMVRVWEFAYVDGQRFMQSLSERGGDELIDQAFLRPPVSSEQVYDVDAYLRNEQPLSVPRPEAPAGTEPLGEPLTLGSFTLQLLAETERSRVGAQAIATAWAGDTAIMYDTGDSWCVDATIVMETDNAASSMANILASAMAESVVNVDAEAPDTIRLRNCIPAPDPA